MKSIFFPNINYKFFYDFWSLAKYESCTNPFTTKTVDFLVDAFVIPENFVFDDMDDLEFFIFGEKVKITRNHDLFIKYNHVLCMETGIREKWWVEYDQQGPVKHLNVNGETYIAQVLVKYGIFTSLSDAYKKGWKNKPVILNDIIKISGKKYRLVQ